MAVGYHTRMGDISLYMTLVDAAAELGVTKARAEQYAKEGRLAVERHFGRVVVLRSEVARFKRTPKLKRGPKPKPKPKGKDPA